MRVWLPVILVLLMSGAANAGEQDPPPPPRPAPDFLFGRPSGTLGLRVSWLSNRSGSDWYDFVTDQLTIDRKNFNGPGIGTDLGITISPRLDVMVGFDYSQSTTASEYRRFVDNNRLPIEQSTLLRGASISGGLKFALTERGREVGRLAWVPRKVVPYIGAGGGAMWFQVRQNGDFVAFEVMGLNGYEICCLCMAERPAAARSGFFDQVQRRPQRRDYADSAQPISSSMPKPATAGPNMACQRNGGVCAGCSSLRCLVIVSVSSRSP